MRRSRSGVVLFTALAGLGSCAKEASREEVIAKHQAMVAPVLASVRTAGKFLARNVPPPPQRPTLPADPVWLAYPSPSNPANPAANSLLAYEQDLIELGKPGDLDEALRIPYSSLLTECAQGISGGATTNAAYLDTILADCAKVRYLFAIRINAMKEPYANPDDETFAPGFLDTVVIVFDLDAPDAPIGSYPVRTESGQQAFVQSEGKGPQGALMSAFQKDAQHGAN
jgi:hypothetical protein